MINYATYVAISDCIASDTYTAKSELLVQQGLAVPEK